MPSLLLDPVPVPHLSADVTHPMENDGDKSNDRIMRFK